MSIFTPTTAAMPATPFARPVAAVSALFLAASCLVLPMQSLAQTAGIHVSGQGSVEVEPDMGYVTLHVRREGGDPAKLRHEIDKVVRAVRKIVGKLKIDEQDVSTAILSINPHYQRREGLSVVDGVIATQSILITLRELDRFDALLQRALEEGVNNVDPIRLDTSFRVELENQALEIALKDAREEAARVAIGLDLRLGAALNVQVVGHSPRPQAALQMRAANDSSTFIPGLIRIERYIQVSFAIDPSQPE